MNKNDDAFVSVVLAGILLVLFGMFANCTYWFFSGLVLFYGGVYLDYYDYESTKPDQGDSDIDEN